MKEKDVEVIMDIVNIMDALISNETLGNYGIHEDTEIIQVITEIFEITEHDLASCNTLSDCMKLISDYFSMILLTQGHAKFSEQKLHDIKKKLINALLRQFHLKVQFSILKRIREVMKRNIRKVQQDTCVQHLIKELIINDGGLDRYINLKLRVRIKTHDDEEEHSSNSINNGNTIANSIIRKDQSTRQR
ncbi:hypothetical protein Fsol_00579 [Candidatus Fokinia solitaria]|uniref:Uncharacterized protein n=1 Tax=Candidatus Fokinia solitaria TaxID=1802984 RepID=A0A2U8BSM9_9RICK|nr:hypothetical protein [Candidatus Fokinia solitaria]AWD33366.1 hypothetical protein Fsol_00579 [Candidatus Fokinia solitaria]